MNDNENVVVDNDIMPNSSKFGDTMGDRLKIVRTFMKMNQKEFAQAVGLYPARISDMEKGTRKVAITVLSYLASKGVDMDWFMNGKREKNDTSLKTDLAVLQISTMLQSTKLTDNQILFIHDMIKLYLQSLESVDKR